MCQRLSRPFVWEFAFLSLLAAMPMTVAAQGDLAESQPAGVVDFQRDVAPVLAARCLECHGSKGAKNDFRVDDREMLLGFIEPGDTNSSSLWVEYLRSKDPDLQMPPSSHGGPLSASELSLISVWIAEGAKWPDGAIVSTPVAVAAVAPAPAASAAPASLPARVWAFQGFLHPATVHFPIALLLVGGLFVVVGWKYPTLGENVSLVCLFLGTLSAIAASAMGWSFAVRQGYGSWNRFDMDSEIFWHRWSAVIVTVAAIATSLFALAWLRNKSARLGHFWKIGLLAIAAMVGAVGHQGGELTYGKTFYQEAFDTLLGNESKIIGSGDARKAAD